MHIPWKLKSYLYWLVDVFGLKRALYFAQKYVTKRSQITNLSINKNWRAHEAALLRNKCTDLIFEFGAGITLAQNLYLSKTVAKQIVVDLNPMIDLELADRARILLAEIVTLRSNAGIRTVKDLVEFGIYYKAPYDASNTELQSGVLDACISTNTLEHIPLGSIRLILKELHRALKKTGIVSVKIDYSDHYAHTDKDITLLNFLRFSEEEWRAYNHRCHYQNRLRHSDYKKLFLESGFDILNEDIYFEAGEIHSDLRDKFKDSDSSWSATSGHFVLKKRN